MIRYLLAEYCPADFYAGWWLYERATNDGKGNGGIDFWGWLRYADPWSPQAKAREMVERMGQKPPALTKHSQAFAEWFAGEFPNGLLVDVDELSKERYRLIEIPESRPRQQPGVIRTIRGAGRADRRRQAEEAAG